MRPFSRLLAAIPACILVVVAARQIYLVRSSDLSPWKGGGFGMFASTDAGPQRRVRLFVEGPDRSEEVRLPRELRALSLRAATLPTDFWLRRLASGLADQEARAGRPVARVRVEVWRTSYAPGDLEPRQSLIRGFEHDVEDPHE